MQTLLQDLRYGIRMLAKNPGFTAIVVFTLALGIGATTAIFSAVNPILFKSLPYPHANRIMAIWETGNDESRNDPSFGMYRGLAERNRSFDALAVFTPWQPTITGAAQPEQLEGQRVSATYFHVLGVSPLLGRDFLASEDRLHGPNVVILSDRLWHRRFGGDRAIVGRQITLDESAGFADTNGYTVIGVMPRGFENVLAPSAELWVPLQYDMSQGRAWGHNLHMVGRLRSGASAGLAAQELGIVGNAVLMEQHPDSYGRGVKFAVTSLQDDITRGVKPALLAIFGAVLLVLVIACVNVTNLLLARGVRRRGEFALRAALGAEHGRLIRQLLTESVLLALMGGVAGMAVAILGVRSLIALSPPELPRIEAIGVDGAVFAFGLGVTTLVGLIFGLTPALQAAHSDPNSGLQHTSRHVVGGHRRTRGALVVVEFALALMLLVCSGLLLRSLQRLFAVPSGFSSSHLLTMQVDEVGHRYDDDGVRYRFWTQTLQAVNSVPGVAAAALTSQLPLSGDLDKFGVAFERDNNPGAAEDTFRYAVTPGYLETIGIPLLRGRLLDSGDRAGAPLVALINESFAKRKFGAQDPMGQRIHIGPTDTWYTIVGVVGDVRQMSLAMSESDAVYTTTAQWHWVDTTMSLVVRTRGDAAALAPDIRKAIWSVDRDVPIVRVATMDGLLAASAAERRFALIVFEMFALSALVLAAAGIYAVLAGSVAERTHEIGVRAALGASRANILALVVREGMTLTVVGVAIGFAGAVAASEAIAAMLFGVSNLDPLTYFGVIALLTAVSLIACFVPAYRAARIDPMVALRYE
jgi:putative ABC transport system permease protein